MTDTRLRSHVALPLTATLLALAGCASGATTGTAQPVAPAVSLPASLSPSPSPTGEPKTYDGAKAAVDALERAAAAHDGGTMWDLLTSSGQAAMTRADYVAVVNECPAIVALPEVTSIAMNAAGTSATVTVTAQAAQGGTYTFNMVYEGGHWKHQPSDSAMGWMGMGANKALTALRNAGQC